MKIINTPHSISYIEEYIQNPDIKFVTISMINDILNYLIFNNYETVNNETELENIKRIIYKYNGELNITKKFINDMLYVVSDYSTIITGSVDLIPVINNNNISIADINNMITVIQ